MTAITETSKTVPTPVAQVLIAFAGIVVRGVRKVAQAAKHRHDAATLAGLDDHMLADIGLTRGDLRDAYAQPLWRDPTVTLASRVGERRANRARVRFGAARRETPAPSIVPAVGANPVIDVTMYR
jgi:uncharacterized protein YjiS (DUF1127 family)